MIVSSFDYTVYGQPVPKARPRFGGAGKHTFTPARTREYERNVRDAVIGALPSEWDTSGTFEVTVYLHFADKRSRDLDNVIKAITDAMNSIAYRDDNQIDAIHGYRRHDKAHPRAEVQVRRLDPA